jgi:hypothetical protein
MFQCSRVILKGRVEIGLGGMAGVARLREKGQIRQIQGCNDSSHTIDQRKIGLLLKIGMDEHQADEQDARTRSGPGSIFSKEIEPGPFPSGKIL